MIARTIASAFSQTIAPSEVLIVDDGSDDDSAVLLSRYSRLRVLCHPANLGRTAARNTLLAAASGDIVIYIDGDTTARPDLVEALLPQFADEQVGCVCGRGEEACAETVYDRWRRRHALQGWGSYPRTDVPWPHGLCCAFRRHLLVRLGGFRGHGEDQDIGYRLHRAGYRVAYTPNARVLHHRHDADWRSLRHMLYRWWRGGYLVERRYGLPATRRMLTGVAADLARHLWEDLVLRPDLSLALLDVRVVEAKLRGLAAGRRLHHAEALSAKQAQAAILSGAGEVDV